jgi:hypothetical protein
MEPRIPTSAGMESVNETVERAKAMVSTSSDTQAPSVSTLEAAPQPLKMPEPANFQPVEIPTFSFLSETSEMKNAKAQTEKQRGNLNMVGNDLYAQMLGLGTQEGEQAKFEQQLGIDAVQVRKTDIENEILQKNNRFLRENEQIMRGTGTTMGQKQAQLNEAQRKQAVDLTDLEIRYQAVTSSLNNISAIAKRKAEIVFGDKKAKVDALKFIYNENKELLTDQEDKLFQKTLLREGKALDIQVKQYQDFEEERLRYLNNAAQAGADNNTLKTIQGVKSLDELYTLDGIQSYALSPADKLDMKIKQRQYDMLGIQMQNEANQAAAAAAAAASGALTEAQLKLANDLRAEVNGLQEVKDAKNLEGDTAALIAALEQENGVGDIAAINSFQRLVVDPGVAVREGDVALLQSAMSFTDMAALKAQGLVKGDKLTPEARKQMLELVDGVYNFRVGLVDENTEQIRTIAQEQGIDYGKYVGRNFKTFEEIKGGITPEAVVQFGVSTTDDYVNSVYSALGTDPAANPFGISLE